jgi:hypothetical protein
MAFRTHVVAHENVAVIEKPRIVCHSNLRIALRALSQR